MQKLRADIKVMMKTTKAPASTLKTGSGHTDGEDSPSAALAGGSPA